MIISSFHSTVLAVYVCVYVCMHACMHACMYVCTFAGCVKQRRLERDELHVVQVFLNGHLNCKASVWVHVGKGQQICWAHKEVSVERVDGQTCRKRQKSINLDTKLNCKTISPKQQQKCPREIIFSWKATDRSSNFKVKYPCRTFECCVSIVYKYCIKII